VIEEAFGFNKQTARSWLGDTVKQWAVETALSVVLMGAMVLILCIYIWV